ncbi:protein N-lysine methyltransferase METTL21A [Zea mays]|uniref:protein N-lysine methyltransferase METTL21A n=1 Tax=Zea mays TaxID=4577 RepID=UPI0004DE7EFC|nr:protein N-lysine methyltransferase METTL21A [Zea mays]|eukprot:XP_008645912.1 protein N-lysine methyltransferase METTL21A [Zea mays]
MVASLQCLHGPPAEMQFTASPVVELPVGGAVLMFEQDNDSFEVGISVWPSSLVLVKFVERCIRDPALPFADVLRFPGTRAVELGSGCGPAGLGLSRLGLTDIAAVLPALRRNLRRNRVHLSRTPRLAQLHWNCPAHLATLATPRRFDLVVAADVVYVQESVPHLIAAMDALADAERGVVLLGYQIRSPEAHQVFWETVPAVFP